MARKRKIPGVDPAYLEKQKASLLRKNRYVLYFNSRSTQKQPCSAKPSCPKSSPSWTRTILPFSSMPEDIQILRDVTVDGVRHITAVPSALVCSRQIDFDLVDGTIRNLRYTAGCHGNLQALGALLEGQPVEFALDRLTGINCKERGTSCSDQLTRVLRAVL